MTFTLKPIGAPGSPARAEQDRRIVEEVTVPQALSSNQEAKRLLPNRPIWSPQEMAEVLDAMARSADRNTLSFREASHIAREAAIVIGGMQAALESIANRPITPDSGYAVAQEMRRMAGAALTLPSEGRK